MDTIRDAAAEAEAALVKIAKEYQDVESKKGLRWFPFIGDSIPTESQLHAAAVHRAAAQQREAAIVRAVDRDRVQVERAKHAFVPAAEHPAFDLPPEAIPKLTFAEQAVSAVERKQALHASFTGALWTALARMRAERRLHKMRTAQVANADGGAQQAVTTKPGRPQKAATASKSIKNVLVPDLNIALLTMPSLQPSYGGATASGKAAPNTGGSLSALAALMASDPPCASNTEVYAPKELRVPWEFKMKHYSKFKLSEDQFATRDPPEVLPNLPAGNAECLELNAGVPPIAASTHFSQPLVTMETFPLFDFGFRRSQPQQGLLNAPLRFPANNGGFADPFGPAPDYGQAGVPPFCVPLDAVRARLHTDALPRPLQKTRDDDSLSDDEEEDPIDLPKPASLRAVAATLPPWQAAGAAAPRPSTSDAAINKRKSVAPQAAAKLDAATADVTTEVPALAFEPRPVHRTGVEQCNGAALRRLTDAAARLESLGSKLPPTSRIVF